MRYAMILPFVMSLLFAGEQVLTTFPESQWAAPDSEIRLDITYESQDFNAYHLPGLGIRIHFNSQQLELTAVTMVFSSGLLNQSNVYRDDGDLDGDPQTDNYLLLSWLDPEGNWPGGKTPLFRLTFETALKFSDTQVRFESTGTSAGYSFNASSATILTNCTAPQITTSPAEETTTCEGEETSIAVTAIASDPSVQWFKNGLKIENAKSKTLSFSPVEASDSGFYRCLIKTDCGDIRTEETFLKVLSPPTLLEELVSYDVCEGESLTLNVQGSGSPPLSYSWFHNGTPLEADTSNLELINIKQAQRGIYTCRLANDCEGLAETRFEVRTSKPVRILIQPNDQKLVIGTRTIFAVEVAEESDSLSFQWFKDDVLIPGENNSQLVLPNADLNDRGLYHCEIKNSCSLVLSRKASLYDGQYKLESLGKWGTGLYHHIVEFGDYIVCGSAYSLDIFDVSDPVNPLNKIGEVSLPSRMFEMEELGGQLYLAMGDAGLIIYDFSTPSDPELLFHMTDFNARALTFSDQLALVSGESDGFYILDISDPRRPILTGRREDVTPHKSIAVYGTSVYLDQPNGNDLFAIDITDPSNPSLLGFLSLDISERIKEFKMYLRWLYVELESGRLEIFTVMGPSSVIHNGGYDPPEGTTFHQLEISPPYVWAAGDVTGVSLIEIVGFGDIDYIMTVDTPGRAFDIALKGDKLYVADDIGGLHLIDTSGSPRIEATFEQTFLGQRIIAEDGLAYANHSGFRIFDVANPFEPSLKGEFIFADVIQEFETFVKWDNFIALGNSYDGIYIFDVSNPSGIEDITSKIYFDDYIRNTFYREGTLIVEGDHSIYFYDVSSPELPRPIDNSFPLNQFRVLTLGRDKLYLYRDSDGVQALDITNPAGAFLLPNPIDKDSVIAMEVVQHHAYIMNDEELRIVNIFNPAKPDLVSRYELRSGTAKGLWVHDHIVYIAQNDTLLAIDVSTKARPELLDSYQLPTQRNILDLAFDDSYIYLAEPERFNVLKTNLCRQPVTIKEQPRSQDVCLNSPLELEVVHGGTGPFAYQWYREGLPIAEATQRIYRIEQTSEADLGDYTCTVSNLCNDTAVTTLPATVSTGTPLNISPWTNDNLSVCQGSDFSVSIDYEGSTPHEYNWYHGGQFLPEQTGPSLELVNIDEHDAGAYTCTLVNGCGEVSTETIRITVLNDPTVNTQPDSITAIPGQTTNLNFVADGGGMSYRWYHKGTLMSGEEGSRLTLQYPSEDDVGEYFCIAENSCGSIQSRTVEVDLARCVTINSQSTDMAVCENDWVHLRVSATGSMPLLFKWFRENEPIEGADEADLIIHNMSSQYEGTYYCQINNICDDITLSESFDLSLKPRAQISMIASQEVCIGEDVFFQVEVGDVQPSAYQWLFNGNPIPYETAPSLLVSSVDLDDAGAYSCRITDSCGNLVSNEAWLTLKDPISIIKQPEDLTQCPGNEGVFTVEATGHGDLNYQWYFGDEVIEGATAATFQPGSGPDAVGTYKCVISHDCGSLDSEEVELYSNIEFPEVEPQEIAECLNASIDLVASYSGSQPVTFQWFHNGDEIHGEEMSTFQIKALSAGDVGEYICVVTGECNNAILNQTAVNLYPPPEISSQTGSVLVLENFDATLEVVSPNSGMNYQWFRNGVELDNETEARLYISEVNEDSVGSYTCWVADDCNGVLSSPIPVDIEENLPPTAASADLVAIQDRKSPAMIIQIVDPNASDVHRVEIATLPSDGALSQDETGAIFYRSDSAFLGTDTCGLRIVDLAGHGLEFTARIQVMSEAFGDFLPQWRPMHSILDIMAHIPGKQVQASAVLQGED